MGQHPDAIASSPAMARDVEKDTSNTTQISLRIPTAWFEDIDLLAHALSRPGMEMARADVIRGAIAKGIESMKREVHPTPNTLRGILSALLDPTNPRTKGAHWTVYNAADDAGVDRAAVMTILKKLARKDLLSLEAPTGRGGAYTSVIPEVPYAQIIAACERAKDIELDAPLPPAE
jgi:hypothetical protein